LRFRDILIYSLVGAMLLPAQQAVPAEGAKLVNQAPQGALKIAVLEGEGQRNSIRGRTAVAPIVEVKDPSDKPVVGAEVVFQLPLAGPGGSFNGWLRSQTVRTDEAGKATVSGYTPNTEAGRFNIKVTATSGSQTGSAVISQINDDTGASVSGTAPAAAVAKKKSVPWKIVGPIIVVAAIVGIAVALRGDDKTTTSTTSTPVSISAGAVTVGVPR
jgi:hypothetical protein